MPHLKRGAMRDFLNIMQAHGYYREANWNRSDFIYTFETGSRIEFFSVDQPDKTRGPRRDRLFMNECNNIALEAFNQLEVRTRDEIYLDWNPTNEFWFYTDVLPARPDDIDHIIITYRDNEALDPNIVASIESRRINKSWWAVYGEGQLGEVEGKIYKDWQILDAIPHEAKLIRRGLDFGYTNDPTAIVNVYRLNGGYLIDEELYRKGMTNKAIADYLTLLEEPNTLIIADSAEPKSIDELRFYGLSVLGANKGPGSLSQGIQWVQEQRVSMTRRSANLIREYRNYLWMTDKDGKVINTPEGGNDHALDATRYALETLKPAQQPTARRPAAPVSSLIY